MSEERPPRKSLTQFEIGLMMFVGATVFLIARLVSTSPENGMRENASAAKAHNLAISMYSYANDNDGNYPSGPTSTAIFQKLYDEKYLQQPGDVYLSMAGKVVCSDNPVKALRAENVSWDIVEHADGTGLNDRKDPDLPLALSTGLGPYTFVDGSNSVKIAHPDQTAWGKDGVTLVTLNQEARFIRPASNSDSINLTSFDFKIGTSSYKSVQP